MTTGGDGSGDHGHPRDPARSRVVLAGALLGVGAAAAVDEIVFHQLLQWHHFVDRESSIAGVVSDGILHALSWIATVAALFLLADLRHRGAVRWSRWWGGVLLGAGGFQVYDGLVQHKLLGLHQVRYGVHLLPYDLAWNLAGAALIVAGAVTLVLGRRRETGQSRSREERGERGERGERTERGDRMPRA